MYDPELSLKIEQDLVDDQMRLQEVENRLGTNHLGTKNFVSYRYFTLF